MGYVCPSKNPCQSYNTLPYIAWRYEYEKQIRHISYIFLELHTNWIKNLPSEQACMFPIETLNTTPFIGICFFLLKWTNFEAKEENSFDWNWLSWLLFYYILITSFGVCACVCTLRARVFIPKMLLANNFKNIIWLFGVSKVKKSIFSLGW